MDNRDIGILVNRIELRIDQFENSLPTLRDRFAMAALIGFTSHNGVAYSARNSATEAYEYADAMLAARSKVETPEPTLDGGDAECHAVIQ